MNSFNQYQPTHLIFGTGRLKEVGRVAKQYGNKAMLVADPNVKNFLSGAIITAIESLRGVGIDVVEFNKVHPNPRLIDVQEGASIARSEGVDLMIAMGGGSSCDTARAIAVASTHEGTAMDYLYFCEKQPTDKTLPMIMIPTTSGTGSHMSCCAVITDETKNFKSALWNRDQLFARTAIVDPELMCTVPKSVTASTGFDVFTHLFESYININHTPYIDVLALEGIRILAAALPKLIDDLGNVELRSHMAWADTLAGTSIANVGTTLPHGMGQPISGHCPHVSHGQSLAVIYPAFMRFTWKSSIERFAQVGRVLNPSLEKKSDKIAAEGCCDALDQFLKSIGMWMNLNDLRVPESEIEAILDHCLEFPDCTVNPIVPTREEAAELYRQSRTN